MDQASLVVSVVWALIAWYGSEGMGMLPTGGASVLVGAPGAFLLYALLGLAAYPGVPPPTARQATPMSLASSGAPGCAGSSRACGAWQGSSNCSPPGGCRARSPGASG